MEVHIVQKGDTLWKISRQYGISFEELKRVNAHLANPDYIVPGMKIFLPAKKEAQKRKPSEDSGVDHKKNEKEKPITPPVVKEKEKVTESVKEILPVPKAPIPLPQTPIQRVPQMQQPVPPAAPPATPPVTPTPPATPMPPTTQMPSNQPMWQIPPNLIQIIGIPCGWMPIYDADCHHHSHMGQMHPSMPMPSTKPPKMPEVDMESSLNTDYQEQGMPSWDMMESTELEVTTKPTTTEIKKPTPLPIEAPEAITNIQMPEMPMQEMPIQQMPIHPMPMPQMPMQQMPMSPIPMPHFSPGSPCGCHFQMMPQMTHANHCNACNQPMPYPMMPQQGSNQVPYQGPQQGQNPNWYGAY